MGQRTGHLTAATVEVKADPEVAVAPIQRLSPTNTGTRKALVKRTTIPKAMTTTLVMMTRTRIITITAIIIPGIALAGLEVATRTDGIILDRLYRTTKSSIATTKIKARKTTRQPVVMRVLPITPVKKESSKI